MLSTFSQRQRSRGRLYSGGGSGSVGLAALCLFCVGSLSSSLAAGAKPARGTSMTPPSLRSPSRLTAGSSDQFLGSLASDAEHLYYVSNRNETAQIFRQDIRNGEIDLIVDDEADVSFPRLSPDGQQLLYISTRDDASGDVCICAAEGGGRRCLTDQRSAEIQAFWYPDSARVGVVSRRGLRGSLALWRLPVSGGKGAEILPGNLSAPAISPDGEWLIWVPIERGSDKVGVSFSMRVGHGLVLKRRGGRELSIRFDLPGITGFPAFSRDGRWLYFVRYLSDTNFDGRIDGDDHGVIFRVRFKGEAKDPLRAARPEQLTSARWSCQYPAPAADRLVMTCDLHGSLDIYSLSLDGAVPSSWGRKKLHEALDASWDPWERLMLLDRISALESSSSARLEIAREITRLHLSLGELTSAAFFARRVLDDSASTAALKGWAAVTLEVVAHRREERRLDRGQLNDRFIADQGARVRRLKHLAKNAPASVARLSLLAQVEVLDVVGREGAALKLLARLKLKAVRDPMVLHAWADRALPLLWGLGDRAGALRGAAVLAQHHALSVGARLRESERLLELILRGQPKGGRAGLVSAWRDKLELDSEAAFRFELESLLLQLDSAPTGGEGTAVRKRVRKAVFKLYRRHTFLPERRALVSAVIRRAAETDSPRILYQFANSWASWVDKGHVERERAVALYRQVVLERGYMRRAEGRWMDAYGSFWGLTLVVDDLEAWVGVIDMADVAHRRDQLARIEKRYRRAPNHPVLHFVRAYNLARKLASCVDREGCLEIIEGAKEELDKVGSGLLSRPGLHHLRGYLAHQRFLWGGERRFAFAAHAHYLMALDLARGNPRFEAALLLAIGVLQAEVGNYWIALEYLDRRGKLPFMDPQAQLSFLLTRARSLFHVGREREGAQVAAEAYQHAQKTVALALFVPLCLDRAALYAYAAGDFKGAASYYRLLKPRMAKQQASAVRSGNRLRAAVMQAAAELGAGQLAASLRSLDRAKGVAQRVTNATLTAGRHPYQRAMQMQVRDYQVIMQGLRAQVLRGLGRQEEAEQALIARRSSLRLRLKGDGEEDVLLQLAAVERDLAVCAARAGDKLRAARRLEAGLALCADYAKQTGTVAPQVRLVLLRAFAELHLFAKLPLKAMRGDLLGELEVVYRFLCQRPNPRRAADRFVFKLYLAMLRAEQGNRSGPKGEIP